MGGTSYLVASFARVLFIYNQQKRTFWVTAWGALLNVVLNIILIPQWGLYGAAWASVATFSLALILLWHYIRKLTPLKFFNRTLIKYLLASIISSSLMALILKFLAFYNVNAIIKVVLGALSYFIILGGFWLINENKEVIIKDE
jgi:O-antigen/teichoic acid export membrane protein